MNAPVFDKYGRVTYRLTQASPDAEHRLFLHLANGRFAYLIFNPEGYDRDTFEQIYRLNDIVVAEQT